MNVSIIGTGAMASLFGARLSRFADVALLGTWTEAVQAFRREGIHVEGEGTFRVHAASDPDDAPPADLAIVLVKSYQTERAALWAARTLKPQGVALTIQNGLGNVEILAARVGVDRAMLGVTTQGATLLGAGRVRPGGRGMTHLGFLPIERAAPRDWSADSLAYEVTALLNAADLSSVVSANVEALAWGKVIINAAINPLTAILRVPNGALAQADDTLELMWSIVSEAAAVAKAHHVELPYPNPFERVKAVALATATNHSSMLQDVLKGRPTEIDAINGKIVEHGRAVGVPTPINATLTALVRAIEKSLTAEGAKDAKKELSRILDGRT
ncbi:MAG TPA: ketopantoate reductase family protein [Anaerolineae bacterium]|nr:ketopantoate reductase family protein [Anaerolineae bacterium]